MLPRRINQRRHRGSSPATIQEKYEVVNKKFLKSCDQIKMINNQIESFQSRYDRAVKKNKRSFRYSLRLRLATLEGMRNMFYEYASRRAEELEQLQQRLGLLDPTAQVWDDEDTLITDSEPEVTSQDQREEPQERTPKPSVRRTSSMVTRSQSRLEMTSRSGDVTSPAVYHWESSTSAS